MRLIWDDRAVNDFRGILGYIGDRNPAAADRLNDAVDRTLELITANPYLYRRGRVGPTREAVVTPNYVIVYRVDDDLVRVVRVLHTRQSYP
jgi:toxin ParE1/3/4